MLKKIIDVTFMAWDAKNVKPIDKMDIGSATTAACKNEFFKPSDGFIISWYMDIKRITKLKINKVKIINCVKEVLIKDDPIFSFTPVLRMYWSIPNRSKVETTNAIDKIPTTDAETSILVNEGNNKYVTVGNNPPIILNNIREVLSIINLDRLSFILFTDLLSCAL